MDTDTKPQQLMSTDDLAEYLNRRPRWVSENAESLGGFKVGALWRFDLTEVQARLNRHRTLDPLTPTPLSAKRQARKSRKAA